MTNTKLINKIISLAIIISIVASVLIIVASFVNRGTLLVDYPKETTLFINGNEVTGNTFKIRSGSYNIQAINPRYENWSDTVNIKPFTTVARTPAQKETSADAVVKAALSSIEDPDSIELSDVKYFQNGDWFVGALSRGSVIPVVMHYDKGWVIEYYPDEQYLNVLDNLPPEISEYINSLYTKYLDG